MIQRGRDMENRNQQLGDWQCPNAECLNHHKMVFGSKTSCPKCGAPKGMGGSAPKQRAPALRGTAGPHAQSAKDGADDWECPNQGCINNTKLVFGRRSSCPSCGAAKEAQNPGDWTCPNTNCINSRNSVFASKSSCPKCGTPRPSNGRIQPLFNPLAMFDPRQLMGMARSMQMMPMVPVQAMQNSGDWRCPDGSCVNSKRLVFAKHASCPLCGTEKPAANGSQPGDWPCPNTGCINHKNKVFAKHAQCPNCGSDAPGARGRSRSPRA